MTSHRRRLVAALVPLLCALAVVGTAVVGPMRPTLIAGAVACTLFAGAALRASERSLLAGQLDLIAIGVALASVSGAGLDVAASGELWRALVGLAAYPFLAHALLRLVVTHRQVREADVLVEAALVGTAVGIVLHAAMSTWGAPATSAAGAGTDAGVAAMFVALDVALVVIGVRSLASPAARRGPLVAIHLGLVLLLGAHLLQQLAVSAGRPGAVASQALVGAGLLALGTAAVHPRAQVEPDRVLEHPVLFSAVHAGVVVLALLAAPAVLVVQTLHGVTASATVATGTVLSGLVLASYLIGLLRERAATEHEATHDALTRLPNRTLLVDRLDRSIAHARRGAGSCAVLFVDLDGFKEINDTFGHAEGDRLLQTIATRLQGCVRDEDTVARLAGDEFVVLLPHLAAADHVVTVAQRIVDALGEPVTVADQRLLSGGSVGVAVFPDDGGTAQELLDAADAAMYRAKERPGSTWEVFSRDLASQAQARLQLEVALLDALERDELVLHYQPILDLRSGRTAGAEALLRWNHPEQGLLLPGQFVPVAEQSDLIVLLGERVILGACEELRRWEDLGIDDRFISVNVSSRQFAPGLVETVTAALRATGANPENLVIELTESTAVDNVETVAAILDELRSLGVRSAIDDFGTGYCGLRYLSELPVATLKIDRSFVQGETPGAAAIVSATIAMAHSLGLTVVAEGVETAEQQQLLLDQGCDRVQGYLLGRPTLAGQVLDRLLAEQAAEAPLRELLASAPTVPLALRSAAIDRRALLKHRASAVDATESLTAWLTG